MVKLALMQLILVWATWGQCKKAVNTTLTYHDF